ncbi:MAG: hypothetical protein KBF56_12225, partial [Gemmatimonadaceae bacterium]|nr:hypothetical protein [Gemmatimonadaceae bacterium]
MGTTGDAIPILARRRRHRRLRTRPPVFGREIDTGDVRKYALCVHRIPVGVFGASGYAGRELCSLINAHPQLELVYAT